MMLPAREESDLLNLRLAVARVNKGTQYVVDIMAGTHDIAPELLQVRTERVMWRERGNRRRAVEMLAEISRNSRRNGLLRKAV